MTLKTLLILPALLCLSFCFNIIRQPNHQPETHIGNKTIACTPGAAGNTSGFATYYTDISYACSQWDGKARALPDCFVALNGICGTDPSKFCDRCINVTNAKGGSQKCRIIDFCDPNDCEFYDAGHLDFLNNNGNANYKFLDVGVYVYPYSKLDGFPKISWKWTTC